MAWPGGCLKDPIAEAERRKKISATLKGHPVSEHTRQAVSAASKGRKDTPERYQKRVAVWTPEKRRKQSLRYLGKPGFFKGRKFSEEHRCNISIGRMGFVHTREEREKLSILFKEKWKDPKFAAHKIQQMHSGMYKGSLVLNKTETALNNVLQVLYPGEYKFVGNAAFWVEIFNPDFINCNGQKKIIEAFGDYWHNRSDLRERDARRLKTYRKYGYETLVLWEKEIYSEGVEEKIRMFHEGNSYKKDTVDIYNRAGPDP